MTTRPDAGLRVLHITAPAEFGGLERVVETLTAGLQSRGVDNTVVAVLSGGGSPHPFVTAVAANGVATVPLVIGARAYLKEASALAGVIRQTRPDVVHTHGYRSDVIGGGAARRAATPAVSTLHGFTAKSWTGRRIEWLQLRTLRRANAVIGVSPAIIDRARAAGIRPERLHLIPNAWSGGAMLEDRTAARRRLGLPENAFVVGWIGRLTHEKGADVFLDAIARWNLAGSEVVASIVGDGRDRAALEARANALGIQARVRWHGVQHNAGRSMAAFDALVLSSRTEGVPMVLLEAMHAGTPIVATAVGGVPSVLDASQALLVPSESPPALASALDQLHRDAGGARVRAERARGRLAAEFAVEPWLDRYLAVYRAAVSGR